MRSSTPRYARARAVCWRHLASSACLLALTGSVHAQVGTDLHVFTSETGGENFGHSVAAVGDVDGDGRTDYAAGAYLASFIRPEAGRVRVFSGADGSTLWVFDGDAAGDQFGFAVSAAGDVDNDGFADVLVGADLGNYARVHSGADGSELYTFTGTAANDLFGAAVAAVGDLDADGHDDVAVGAPGADGAQRDAGAVRVYSGFDGSELLALFGQVAGTGLGRAVASARRVNDDAVPDVICGGNQGSNLALVFSGADGSLLHTFSGDASLDWFGTSVAGVGDVNLDGADDLLVGAPQGFLGSGYARVFSGADGTILRQHDGSASLDLFGWAVTAAGDVDRDGRLDYTIGAPFADPSGIDNGGEAVTYSGTTGGTLLVKQGQFLDGALGWSLDGGPCANLIVGGPLEGPGGEARVVDTAQFDSPTTYCSSTPNSTGSAATIGWTGSNSVAENDLVLITTGCPNGTIGIYFSGAADGQSPFGNGFLCTDGAVTRLGVTFVDGTGTATRPIDVDDLPGGEVIRVGEVRYFQYWYRNPAGGGAGFNLSDGLRVPFCD